MKYFQALMSLIYLHDYQSLADKKKKDIEASFLYDVMFVPQIHSNLCGDACEAMMRGFIGEPVASMSVNPRGIGDGRESVGDARLFNLKRLPSIQDLPDLLQQEGPVIIDIPLRWSQHYVLCVGFVKEGDKTSLVYHDPLMGGNKLIALDELEKLYAERMPKDYKREYVSYRQNVNYIPKVNTLKRNETDFKYREFATSDHSDFFRLSDNFNPVKASLDLLKDYATGSRLLHPWRNHREKVQNFLDNIQYHENGDCFLKLKDRTLLLDEKNLVGILDKFLSTGKNNPSSSLYRRLATISAHVNPARQAHPLPADVAEIELAKVVTPSRKP